MRVIGGSRRGLKLFEFMGSDVRPTTDRVKENIFNIIAPYIPEARVFDMFSGSGALGIEALSRGADNAVFCDSAAASVEIIKNKIAAAKFESNAKIIKGDAFETVCSNGKFDIIFLDPPYNKGMLRQAVKTIAANDALSDEGIIVAERDNTEEIGDILGVSLIKEKKYGRSFVCIYKKD